MKKMKNNYGFLIVIFIISLFLSLTFIKTYALEAEKILIKVNTTELNTTSNDLYVKTTYKAKEVYVVAESSEEGVKAIYDPIVVLKDKQTVVNISFEKEGEKLDYKLTIIKADATEQDVKNEKKEKIDEFKGNLLIFFLYFILLMILYGVIFGARKIIKLIVKKVKKEPE